jgi:hypothetical protein
MVLKIDASSRRDEFAALKRSLLFFMGTIAKSHSYISMIMTCLHGLRAVNTIRMVWLSAYLNRVAIGAVD